MLSTPSVAVTIGLVFGACLIVPLFFVPKILKAGNSDAALYAVVGCVFGGLVLALCVLLAYRFIAPGGVMAFGLAMGGGYLGGLLVLIVVSIRRLMSAKSPMKSGDGAKR
jgi:hypothetical protein